MTSEELESSNVTNLLDLLQLKVDRGSIHKEEQNQRHKGCLFQNGRKTPVLPKRNLQKDLEKNPLPVPLLECQAASTDLCFFSLMHFWCDFKEYSYFISSFLYYLPFSELKHKVHDLYIKGSHWLLTTEFYVFSTYM